MRGEGCGVRNGGWGSGLGVGCGLRGIGFAAWGRGPGVEGLGLEGRVAYAAAPVAPSQQVGLGLLCKASRRSEPVVRMTASTGLTTLP